MLKKTLMFAVLSFSFGLANVCFAQAIVQNVKIVNLTQDTFVVKSKSMTGHGTVWSIPPSFQGNTASYEIRINPYNYTPYASQTVVVGNPSNSMEQCIINTTSQPNISNVDINFDPYNSGCTGRTGNHLLKLSQNYDSSQNIYVFIS